YGAIRRYFRKAGCKRVPLRGLPGSDKFMLAYQRALDGVISGVEIGAARTKPGSVNAVIVSYFRSEAFTKALAPETQRMRRNILDRFRSEHGDKRLSNLERRHIVKLLENRKPHAQKNWLKTLRGLMLFAITENVRADDPTAGVKPIKLQVKSKGH